MLVRQAAAEGDNQQTTASESASTEHYNCCCTTDKRIYNIETPFSGYNFMKCTQYTTKENPCAHF